MSVFINFTAKINSWHKEYKSVRLFEIKRINSTFAPKCVTNSNNVKYMIMNIKFILPFCVAAALMATSCKKNAATESTKVQVQAITLKDTTCTVEYSYPATMKGIQDVAIYPQVSGRITAIRVKEGQHVDKGDILFEIDDIPYDAAYQSALAQVEVSKAQLETAKLTLQSKQNLFDRDIISEYQLNLAKNDVVTAEAVLGQSKAALQKAANDLSFTKVRTMGAGYIGSLPYKVGSLVGSNITEPLTVVSDNSQIYADFSMTENNYLELYPGAGKDVDYTQIHLSLQTNLGQRYPLKGHLHSISGLISNETGALPCRAIFPNPDRILLSGGSCKVILTSSGNSVITVPRSAMKEIQDKLFIFVIRNGKLEQTAVNAVRLNAKQWVLTAGEDGNIPVKAGDQITATTNRLKDGDEVTIIK